MDTQKTVKDITEFVSSFSLNQNEFNEVMSHEHRTKQQSFTRLCIKWLEHVSSADYKTDLRNDESKKVARELIETFEKKHGYRPSSDIYFI
jgi:hypothetical protein